MMMDNEWIELSKQLPKQNQKIVLWLEPDLNRDGRLMFWSWEKESTANIKINGQKATHYIPLPQPPVNKH